MEFLPDKPFSPLLRSANVFDVHSVLRAQELDLRVGRHFSEGLGHAFRTFHVHVAPPENGLDALERRQAAVVPQDGSQPRVHPAFYGVVRRGKRPLRRQRGVEIREQRAGVDQGYDSPARPAQALVRVDEAPVDEALLRQEVGLEVAPLQEALGPPFGLAEAFDMRQLLCEAVELYARLQLWPARRLAPDLAERMEDAPLHPGARPFGGRGLGEPAPSVGHDHVGRGDSGKKRAPCRARLRTRQMPREHVALRAGDQHHHVARDPDAVDENDAMHLVYHLGHRPDRPEGGGPPPKRAPLPGHVALRVLGEQP